MPSPPQGFTVILPGEITQSDLDPQQPPAKLSSYPLTIGRDIPGPNESNYIANDNTGNLLDIANSDTSSITLSALKMAIDEITLIRTNGELAMNLANENNWSVAQSFAAGVNFTGSGSNGVVLDFTAANSTGPYIDSNFNVSFPGAVAGDGWNMVDNSGTSVLGVSTGGTRTVSTANNELDNGSGDMSVAGTLATASLNLNGSGAISALVSSFNGKTGAVVPASGDYLHHATINSGSTVTTYAAGSITQVGTIKTRPNGVVFWLGACLTESASSGGIVITVGSGSLTNGVGPTSTTGGTWSIGDSNDFYPVMLNGIADSSNGSLSPNTSYDIYLQNVSGSSITVLSLSVAVIGF
jgi:hypothetical protein